MTKILQNDRLIKALLCQPVDQTPVWIMRQAGRYLPEYQEVRARAGDFLTLCQTPELACEVTLQPLKRFNLDAAIVFSDILTIPDAMGLGLRFFEGEGPMFEQPITDARSIQRLPKLDPETDLKYVLDTIRHTVTALDKKVPLIGFAGSPWTLAAYMIEGGGSREFKKIKTMLYREPALLQQLLKKLTTAVADYLNAQITAGVDAVMIFDTWGGILSAHNYQQYSLNYTQEIISHLKHLKNHQQVPVILFTKGGGQWLEWQSESGCDCVGLDWTVDIGQARHLVANRVSLQGNLDPAILYAEPTRIREEVECILRQYGPGNGHVFNLGHGIQPDTPPEHVTALIDAVHEISVPFHQKPVATER